MASPTAAARGREGTSATSKMIGGMKELWKIAKKDLKENSRDLKQDIMMVVEAAKIKRTAPKDQKLPTSLLVQAVNVDVGSELLTKYKEEWGLIHGEIEEASQASATLNSDLMEMHRSIQHTHSVISACCAEFKQLPEVVRAIENTREKVQELGNLLGKVEQSIVEYSRSSAELEAVRKKGSLKIQYNKQSATMEREVQRLQEVLAEERRLKEGTEKERKNEMVAERQQAFQDMFQQQMADYRETGAIERAIAGGTDSTQLEDIVIEDTDGTASLNEFLSDVDDVMPGEESHDRSHDSDDNVEVPSGKSHDLDNHSTEELLENALPS